MSSNLYNLYINGIYEIAETLVFKHSLLADTVNKGVAELGYPIDYGNLSTWKYYQNMAGIYHVSDMDKISSINANGSPYMQIKLASDTGSIDIDFTTALVDLHTGNIALANEYQYGSYLYKELVSRYPDFEELILGIINPVPITISTQALDGDILYCGGYFRQIVNNTLGKRQYFSKSTYDGYNDKNLIEENEIEVIHEIETGIKSYLDRWHNPDYVQNNNLYIACLIGIIASHLPSMIFNARLKRIHTPQTHSFLVREFFESNGGLDKYTSNLPLKQRLYLYRNLRYLNQRVGKQEVIKKLIDNIATPLRVPLSTYTLRHNLTDVPEELLPNPVIRREILNFRQAGTGRDAVDIGNILRREIPIAKDNAYDIENVELAIENEVQISHNNRLPTKIIDSQMLDLTDTGVFQLSRVIYDLWVYGVFTNKYQGVVYITHPLTGDRISLTPRNALILTIYCYSKGYFNTELQTIPTMKISMHPKSVNTPLVTGFGLLPNAATLTASISDPDIDDTFSSILLGSVYETPIMSTSDQFYREAVKLHKEINRRYALCVSQTNPFTRAKTEYGMSTLYWLNTPVTISTQSYDDWFISTGISISGLSSGSYVNVANEILNQISGNRPNNNQLIREILKSVIGILKHFSSYTTQFISSINNVPALSSAKKGIRSTDPVAKLGDTIKLRPGRFRLKSVTVKPISSIAVNSSNTVIFTE